MDILQTAEGVVSGTNAQQLLAELVPGFRHLIHGKTPFHQLLLDFVPQHDVQHIADLIAVGADTARLHLVDRPVELVEADSLELRGKPLLKRRPQRKQEGTATSDDVLPKTRLALVQRVAGAAGDGGSLLPARRGPLLIQRMTAFVDRAVEGVHDTGIRIAGGDAHILFSEGRGKGMGARPHQATAEVESHRLHHLPLQGLLRLDGIGFPKEGIVDGRSMGDDVADRRQQGSEQRVDPSFTRPLLVVVQQHVVQPLARLPATGGTFLLQVEDTLERRSEQLPILLAAGLKPNRIPLGSLLADGSDEGGRDYMGLAVLLATQADERTQERIRSISPRIGLARPHRLQDLPHQGRGSQLVHPALDVSHLTATLVTRLGRSVELLVPFQYGADMAEQGNLPVNRLNLSVSLFFPHGPHCRRLRAGGTPPAEGFPCKGAGDRLTQERTAR